MARTKEFDPDVALRAALDLFWRRGYEATTMQHLVDHLGIGRGSLYATFGGKHDLYLRALDRYTEDLAAGSTAALLTGPGPALPGIRAFLEQLAADALADPDRKGCLITNTAVECLPVDRQAARRVEDGIGGLEAALAGALVRARDQGELGADKDPLALARFLITVVEGIRVMCKIPDRQRLHDAVESALSVLT